jgi:hypothetical protein
MVQRILEHQSVTSCGPIAVKPATTAGVYLSAEKGVIRRTWINRFNCHLHMITKARLTS